MNRNGPRRTKKRIDALIVERGLVHSRREAKARILAGEIFVDEVRLDKVGALARIDAKIELKGEPRRYVSRGALKLKAAFETFNIDPTGKTALDLGASTGGFTDLILQSGAKRVYAVDVGRAQLDFKLRRDSRVVTLEGVNARLADFSSLIPEDVDLITADLSFISATIGVAPSLVRLKGNGILIILVKPQFEAGKEAIGKGGLVGDENERLKALAKVVNFFRDRAMEPIGSIQAPIKGAKSGNIEYLALFRKVARK